MSRSRGILAACIVGALVVLNAGSHLTAQTGAFKPPEPPDGRWLVDGEGREYFVVEIPRRRLERWTDESHTRIRLFHGIEMDVVSYTDTHVRVKTYRAVEAPAPEPRRGPTAEELERTAATYRAEAIPGPGLDLRDFGEGLPRDGQWRNGFDVADVNGDGHLDIVFGPPRKGLRRTPVIFLGDGAGHWKPFTGARYPGLSLDYGDAKVADLNGDGIPDLVVAAHLRGIVALIGDGRAGFTLWSRGVGFASPGPAKEPVFTSRALAIVDWNGDGRPDILALGEGPSLGMSFRRSAPDSFPVGSGGATVYLNQGNGAWTRLIDRDGKNFGSSIAVADFNRDGRVDFVAGSDRWGFTSLLNLAQADGTWKETPLPDLRRNGIHQAVAAADFDGDGRPDLAVSFLTREHRVFRTGVDVLLNRTTGWQLRTLAAIESPVAIHRLATGDLDGDGHADLVGVDGHGALWVFRGDGKGGFTREPVQDVKPGERCRGYGLRLVDLDRDGRDEIVVSFADEQGTQSLGIGRPPESPCRSEGGLQAWKVVRKP